MIFIRTGGGHAPLDAHGQDAQLDTGHGAGVTPRQLRRAAVLARGGVFRTWPEVFGLIERFVFLVFAPSHGSGAHLRARAGRARVVDGTLYDLSERKLRALLR